MIAIYITMVDVNLSSFYSKQKVGRTKSSGLKPSATLYKLQKEVNY